MPSLHTTTVGEVPLKIQVKEYHLSILRSLVVPFVGLNNGRHVNELIQIQAQLGQL